MYDGSCNLAFHGHNTQYMNFMCRRWCGTPISINPPIPTRSTNCSCNKRAKLATENVFHSLLDMADIRYGTEQLERSFLSKKFKPHKRYVDSYGWTDYDNAILKGDCREVIGKRQPLSAEKIVVKRYNNPPSYIMRLSYTYQLPA